MDNEKFFKTRIIQKHDTKANWDLATDFIPYDGEIIIYDDLNKIKIGDGVTPVPDLAFASLTELEIRELIKNNGIQISETQPSYACTWFRPTSIT
jgi:hypothetical protein